MKKKVLFSEKERSELIDRLTAELPSLRARLNLSQDEISAMLDISRQTYCTIETQKRKMTWSICLSLIFIFDNNPITHEYVRNGNFFPNWLFGVLSDELYRTARTQYMSKFVSADMLEELDSQALHSIQTVIMVEYARCMKMTSEQVVKAFEGTDLTVGSDRQENIRENLQRMKRNA